MYGGLLQTIGKPKPSKAVHGWAPTGLIEKFSQSFITDVLPQSVPKGSGNATNPIPGSQTGAGLYQYL